MANQIVISRIQNRRGIRENLPQPLLPGEFALTVDTGELWIGTDPQQPPWGVRTYGSGAGDISSAENIVDLQIVSAKFSPDLDQVDFDALVLYLTGTPTPAVVLVDTDILWDGGAYVFIAADTSVDGANTISNIVTAVTNSAIGAPVAQAYDALGAINDPSLDPVGLPAFDADGQFLFGSGSATQGANAARLINQIHGAQLVTTLSNLQVTTSGIGVGSSTFRDWQAVVAEGSLPWAPTYNWSTTGQATADSVTDKMYLVPGPGIQIEVDTVEDAIKITNTFEQDFDILYAPFPGASQFTLALSTAADVTGLLFDMTESDVIFLDYSLNIAGATPGANNYTVAGSMQIVGNALVGAGTATLNDTQVEVRDAGLPGAVTFTAAFVGGTPDIQIAYNNTFTSAVTMRVVRRRWASF